MTQTSLTRTTTRVTQTTQATATQRENLRQNWNYCVRILPPSEPACHFLLILAFLDYTDGERQPVHPHQPVPAAHRHGYTYLHPDCPFSASSERNNDNQWSGPHSDPPDGSHGHLFYNPHDYGYGCYGHER